MCAHVCVTHLSKRADKICTPCFICMAVKEALGPRIWHSLWLGLAWSLSTSILDPKSSHHPTVLQAKARTSSTGVSICVLSAAWLEWTTGIPKESSHKNQEAPRPSPTSPNRRLIPRQNKAVKWNWALAGSFSICVGAISASMSDSMSRSMASPNALHGTAHTLLHWQCSSLGCQGANRAWFAPEFKTVGRWM